MSRYRVKLVVSDDGRFTQETLLRECPKCGLCHAPGEAFMVVGYEDGIPQVRKTCVSDARQP